MKNLREKFKNNVNLVRPLYRYKSSKVEPKKDMSILINVDSTFKLDGDDCHVKRKVVSNKCSDYNIDSFTHENNTHKEYNLLPNVCESNHANNIKHLNRTSEINNATTSLSVERKRQKIFLRNMKDIVVDNNTLGEVGGKVEDIPNKSVQDSDNATIILKAADTWLRVYPAPSAPGEAVHSTVFRCVVCQLGLTALLILWTIIFVIIINTFEEPYESEITTKFENEQNQLVIDLATELRLITPLSPKWREAIEKRLAEERKLTVEAVGKGARITPGQFWSLPGTFLFSIYVMTALGFGAPVPQTMWGRTYAIIYAVIAVPTHIYLMMNVSTCVVVNVENIIKRVKMFFKEKVTFVAAKTALGINRERLNCSGNSELKSSNRSYLRRKILCIFGALCVGRCLPLVAVLYYFMGIAVFALSRSKQPTIDVVMFPLEFTTSGGLEHVEGFVRLLYGFYVEGAMTLIACALATLRRHSGYARTKMSKKYRLFASEH